MAESNQDLAMHSGDDVGVNVTIRDEAGAVIDVSSASAFRYQAAEYNADNADRPWHGSAVISKALGSGVTVTDGPNGVVRVTLSSADTASLEGRFYHELEMTLGGAVSTVMTGLLTIQADLAA